MITPLPFGGGEGGGASWGRGRGHHLSEPCVFCSSVFSVRKNTSFFICHYVILSYKNHQFLSLTLLFCLQKTSVSLCHYVILSSKKHLSPSVPLLFCLQDHPFCLSCPHVTLSSKLPCLPLSLGHYVGHQRIQNLDKTVQKKQKRGCVYYDTPSFVMLLPRRGNQFSASFLFLSSICDVFYSNVHISCNNLCITLEVFSVVPLQITFKSSYRRQS